MRAIRGVGHRSGRGRDRLRGRDQVGNGNLQHLRQVDQVLATWTNIAALPLAHLLNVLDAESVGNVFEFQTQLFAPGFEFGAGQSSSPPCALVTIF